MSLESARPELSRAYCRKTQSSGMIISALLGSIHIDPIHLANPPNMSRWKRINVIGGELRTLILFGATLLSALNIPALQIRSRVRFAGAWIWTGEREKPVDAYRLFRKSFRSIPSRRWRSSRSRRRGIRLFVKQYMDGPAPNPIATRVDEIVSHQLSRPQLHRPCRLHLGVPSFRARSASRLLAHWMLARFDRKTNMAVARIMVDSRRATRLREYTEILDGRKEPSMATRVDDSSGASGLTWPVGVEP